MKKSQSICKKEQININITTKIRGEKHNLFTELVNKFAPSTNHDTRTHSTDSAETYAYERNKEIINKQDERNGSI